MALERILFLSDMLYADGATLRTFDLARALNARGIEAITVISGGRLAEKFRKAGLPVRYQYRINRKLLPYAFNAKIVQLARSIEPSIVHARCPRLSALAARLARACRTRYVVTVNSIAESRCSIKRSRRCAGVIACSQFIREWLVNDRNIPKEVITVIPSGVDVDPFDATTDIAGAVDREAPDDGSAGNATTGTVPVIGMIGGFTSGAGHDCFLKAAAMIAAEIPEAQFIIAGEQGETVGRDRYVRARVEKANLLKKVTIIPAFQDFRQLLASIDVLLVPSSSEGRSRLILDAMACRRPVVATGVGENYEIIRDGENGLLVQKDDAEAMAAGAVNLLTDSELRHSILDRAFECVRKEYSLARMTKNVIDFYTRALER